MISPSEAQRTLQHTAKIASRLGHDFSNYLTTILGFTELAVKLLPDNSPSRSYLQEVWQAAKNGTDWVHKLLFLSRGKPAQFVPTNLLTLFQEEEIRLTPLWKKTVIFTTCLEQGLPLVDVDKESLQCLLQQLLNNAREAIREQGTIALSARKVSLVHEGGWEIPERSEDREYVEITVSDTGRGLSAQTEQKVYTEPFFTTKPCHRGLGLLTVAWIVQLYQGVFRLVPRPEQGVLAQVLLPAAGSDLIPKIG